MIGTKSLGGGGVTLLRAFLLIVSYTCTSYKIISMALVYRKNVLTAHIAQLVDNLPLADRPIFMDNIPRPHRARNIREFRKQEAIVTLQWPAMFPDMNSIEYAWTLFAVKWTNVINTVKTFLNYIMLWVFFFFFVYFCLTSKIYYFSTFKLSTRFNLTFLYINMSKNHVTYTVLFSRAANWCCSFDCNDH